MRRSKFSRFINSANGRSEYGGARRASHPEWPEFAGGGLLRSVGGWDEVKALRKKKRRMISDARILGSNAFVRKILKQSRKSERARITGAKLRRKIETTIRQSCKKAGVTVAELQAGSRRGIIPSIRLELAHRLTKELGVTLIDASRHLGVTPSALSKALTRARAAKQSRGD